MNLYRFKTFRTSYFFPAPIKGQEFLYGLYTPFGSNFAKAYWWAFSHLAPIRIINLAKNINAEFPYDKIMEMCPKGSTMSFNMGTPGPEQKISMLGIEPIGRHFFAKYSEKEDAKSLSRNEIKVLTALHGIGVAPELYDHYESKDFVFFRTSCIDGKTPNDLHINDNIVNLSISINKQLLSVNTHSTNGLQLGLSHGDYTPWNVIIGNGKHHMIDWEMAEDRELGYDIFTYIIHVSTLFDPDASLLKTLESNTLHIKKYFKAFAISDWKEYLSAFAQHRIKYYSSKGNWDYALKYESLL